MGRHHKQTYGREKTLNQTEPTLEEAVQKLEASSGKGIVEPNA
jgi:hypothetical protein